MSLRQLVDRVVASVEIQPPVAQEHCPLRAEGPALDLAGSVFESVVFPVCARTATGRVRQRAATTIGPACR